MREMKILIAELFGTFLLMMGGPGVAVLGATPGSFGDAGTLAVALGFGFSLTVIAYSIGPISGGHVNPAVTLAMLITRRIEARTVPSYLVGQVVGAVLGGLVIWTIASNASDSSALGRSWDGATDSNFATNLWTGEFMGFWPMVIVELTFTAILVFVVLSTTSKRYSSQGAIGVHVGIVLALIHLISIPVDNTSVNPIRSLGMAIFAGGDSLEQLWAFFVFPLLGALIGTALWVVIGEAGDVDDRSRAQSSAQAAAARATASVRRAVED